VTDAEVEALLPAVGPAICERVIANAARAADLDVAGYRRAGIRCAFLDEGGSCLAYDVRPLRCRAHVSTALTTCERVHAGDLPGGAVPGDGWLAAVAAACQRGLGESVTEFHSALATRLLSE